MTNAQPEPSMEEILASIRRIISEDEEEGPDLDHSQLKAPAPVKSSPSVSVKQEVAPHPKPVATTETDEGSSLTRMLDIAEGNLERGETVDVVKGQDPAIEDNFDNADTELETEDVRMVKQQAALEESVADNTESIVDTTTAAAASAAFGSLSRTVRVADDEGQTLEALVVEMLRPMVKEWLDANLSRIVEEKVEYEVQRLARRS